jgi:peptide/nickel transport system substrate-binding protein
VLGTYQLAGWRNFGSIDPDGDYLWWHSNAIQPSPKISTNVARYADPEIDKALDDARGTSDPAARAKDYEVVTRRLNAGVPYVWLGRPTWVIAASPKVQGISAAANGSGATLGAKTWLAKLWISN